MKSGAPRCRAYLFWWPRSRLRLRHENQNASTESRQPSCCSSPSVVQSIMAGLSCSSVTVLPSYQLTLSTVHAYVYPYIGHTCGAVGTEYFVHTASLCSGDRSVSCNTWQGKARHGMASQPSSSIFLWVFCSLVPSLCPKISGKKQSLFVSIRARLRLRCPRLCWCGWDWGLVFPSWVTPPPWPTGATHER
ncbi:hypothetical protein B0T24DRAFT_10375 [Lasiosphaeria ovina]|uniref:Uncharacterized protein n=1 Tax=Lasiosphaeria ovina TaxID=92902 RepID=A0AAE0TWN7_9PEZI|nr:hypothetical protein B0T24DRAFT_10375 [Lasiosphaeria ovina]